ncbi:MAG TPA: CvpA family protein [Aquaticitalea sp.]|nr:CvpA family protein [Aquaticitalea sp.]
MGFLDIILILLLALGLIRGFMRGLFVELASLVALLAGVYGAIHFSNYAATFLENHVDWEEKYVAAAAFALTFIIIVLVITLAGKALTKLANFAMLGIVNKLLGALFGLMKTAFILSILLVIIEKISPTLLLINEETEEESALYTPLHNFAPSIFPILLESKEELEEHLEEEPSVTETNQ